MNQVICEQQVHKESTNHPEQSEEEPSNLLCNIRQNNIRDSLSINLTAKPEFNEHQSVPTKRTSRCFK